MTDEELYLPGIADPRVLHAMRRVPRRRFVPEGYEREAFGDYPLPIGYSQTISQPYIVALMTELLQVEDHHKVLEIGTGSGYQAAILSVLAKAVYTIERIRPLADAARERLQRLGYANVHIRVGDGWDGWPEESPFDRIMLTSAAPVIPPPLVDQLADPGRLVAPIGPRGQFQQLIVLTKEQGKTRQRDVTGVAFVPLLRGVTGEDGEPEAPGGDDERT